MSSDKLVLNFSQSLSLRIVIYLLLRLISCNLATWCLAVTGGGSVHECGRLNQAGLRFERTIYTCLLTYGWPAKMGLVPFRQSSTLFCCCHLVLHIFCCIVEKKPLSLSLIIVFVRDSSRLITHALRCNTCS